MGFTDQLDHLSTTTERNGQALFAKTLNRRHLGFTSDSLPSEEGFNNRSVEENPSTQISQG